MNKILIMMNTTQKTKKENNQNNLHQDHKEDNLKKKVDKMMKSKPINISKWPPTKILETKKVIWKKLKLKIVRNCVKNKKRFILDNVLKINLNQDSWTWKKRKMLKRI